MSAWQIVDCTDPVEEDDHPRMAVDSETDLRNALEQYRQRRPGLIFLEGPALDGEHLRINIGGPFAALGWMKGPSFTHYRVALAHPISSPCLVKFKEEGDINHILPEHLLPVDQVIAAAVHYYRTHELPDWIAWKRWWSYCNQWEIIPARSQPPVPLVPVNGEQPAPALSNQTADTVVS